MLWVVSRAVDMVGAFSEHMVMKPYIVHQAQQYASQHAIKVEIRLYQLSSMD